MSMHRLLSLAIGCFTIIPVASFTTTTPQLRFMEPDARLFLSAPKPQTKPNNLHKIYLSSPDNTGNDDIEIPSCIKSPVLSQVYPAIISHNEKYGNPNIPLGSSDGKRCRTLRRLHFQNKLTDEEVTLLADIGFRFHSFEDVYYECDFDEMLEKLLEYKREFQTFQIPKKYQPDPELGAWVTMLRRLHRTNDLPSDQMEKLDEVEFEWVSTRKCGSSFMSRYREVLSQLNEAVESDANIPMLLAEDEELKKWIVAQKTAFENGKLSESRVQYMDDIPGVNWREIV